MHGNIPGADWEPKYIPADFDYQPLLSCFAAIKALEAEVWSGHVSVRGLHRFSGVWQEIDPAPFEKEIPLLTIGDFTVGNGEDKEGNKRPLLPGTLHLEMGSFQDLRFRSAEVLQQFPAAAPKTDCQEEEVSKYGRQSGSLALKRHQKKRSDEEINATISEFLARAYARGKIVNREEARKRFPRLCPGLKVGEADGLLIKCRPQGMGERGRPSKSKTRSKTGG